MQGIAETGPRALGHRSILASPCNPGTRTIMDQRIKYREIIRLLAPMTTLKAAQKWFELSDGASDLDHNSHNHIVLAARAYPESYSVMPAIIHRDATVRPQIVLEQTDQLI